VVAFCQMAPSFFFALFGGAIADRFDRRQVLYVTNAISLVLTALLAALTFSGAISVALILLIALGLGLTNAIDIPVRQSMTVEMVGRTDLQSAIALNSIMFNMARIVGPALGGLVVEAVGEAWCFAINATSYLAAIGALALMRLMPQTKTASRGTAAVREGAAYVWSRPRIRNALLLLAATSFFGTAYLTLMPAFAATELRIGAQGLGFLMAAVGAGGIAGALVMTRQTGDRLRATPPVAAIAFGLFLGGVAIVQDVELALPAVGLAGFCMMLVNTASNTIVQMETSDAMRGRVMAFFSMAMVGVAPFGAAAFGALAEATTVREAVGIGAACVLAAGLAALWYRRTHAGT